MLVNHVKYECTTTFPSKQSSKTRLKHTSILAHHPKAEHNDFWHLKELQLERLLALLDFS